MFLIFLDKSLSRLVSHFLFDFTTTQGVTLALARSKVSGERKSLSLAHLASTIFVAKKLFKLRNKHCVLHSILAEKTPTHKLIISILQSFIFQTA